MKETSLAVVTQSMSSLQIAEITGKRHDAILRDIRKLLEQGVQAHNFVESHYEQILPTGGKKQIPCYQLTKKGCLILASGYNAVLREKIIDRWEELENGTAEPMAKAQVPATAQVTLGDRLAWVKEVKQLLNLNDVSTLGLLQKVGEPLGLPLPDYVPSRGNLRSASFLLKENGSPMSIQQFNKLMIQHGLMVELSRPSGFGGVRQFKSIVGDGLNYGENQVCPSFPNGTQPLCYAHRFRELLELLVRKGGLR